MPRVSTRNPDKDPAAFFGRELRLLRAAGFRTQDSFAAAIHMSQDNVSRIETGNQVPLDDIFDLWLTICKASAEQRDYLLRALVLARNSRGAFPEFIQKFIDAEQKAEFLRLWAPVLVPGQLQVEEYATETFRLYGKTEEEAAEETAARIGRQVILDGPDRVHVTAVFHESVLHRRVGTPEVMVKQLNRLLEASQKPNIIVQIVREDAYFFGMESPCEIAIGDEITDILVMVAVEDQVTDSRDMVRKAIAVFEEIRSRALKTEESRAVMMEALRKWESQ